MDTVAKTRQWRALQKEGRLKELFALVFRNYRELRLVSFINDPESFVSGDADLTSVEVSLSLPFAI